MKKYSILLNNRRHLKVSHNQRKQLNSSGYPSCGPRIFESCTRKVHKKSKNYASRRGLIEHLVVFWQTPQGVCKKRNFTLQGGPQVAERPRVYCSSSSHQKSASADDKSKHNMPSPSSPTTRTNLLTLALYTSHSSSSFGYRCIAVTAIHAVCVLEECFTIFRGEKRHN